MPRGAADALEHARRGRLDTQLHDGHASGCCDEVPAEQRPDPVAQIERAARRQRVGDTRRQRERSCDRGDASNRQQGRRIERGRRRAPCGQGPRIDRSPRVVAQDREVLSQVRVGTEFVDRRLPGANDFGRGRGEQPGGERRHAAPRSCGAQALEQGSVAEQIKIGRVQVLRVGEVFSALAGTGPGVVQPREAALVERDRPLQARALRLDPVEAKPEPEDAGQRREQPPAGVSRAADDAET